MRSPQTLSEADRRLVAAWAADCAERVLWLFEAEAPGDDRPRTAIARTRAFARGELNTAEEIRRRFVDGVPAGEVTAPAAAAARAAGQAVAVCHMGAHALGAAAYAVRAASLTAPDRPAVVDDEIRWQISHATAEVRAALRALPLVGDDQSGPSGPGFSPRANSAPSSATSKPVWPSRSRRRHRIPSRAFPRHPTRARTRHQRAKRRRPKDAPQQIPNTRTAQCVVPGDVGATEG